jgi:hypothetical protein
MGAKYFSAAVIGCEFVPVFTQFAKAINHPDDLLDFLANILWPPRLGTDTLARQTAEPGNLPSSLTGKGASHEWHLRIPNV